MDGSFPGGMFRIIKQSGPAFISDNTFFSGQPFFIFWALSVPLGSILSAVGLALYVRLEKSRFLIFIICATGFLAWLGFGGQSVIFSVLYGIAGGFILLSFCISVWSIAKTRMYCTGIKKNALDLRAISYIFFVITAWGMCGLLGVPSFGLYPEKIIEYNLHHLLYSMGAKVVIGFTLGWIFLALSQFVEYVSHKQIS